MRRDVSGLPSHGMAETGCASQIAKRVPRYAVPPKALGFYTKDSKHLLIEMENGGTELEGFKVNSMLQIKSILSQICNALSFAEENIEFEHRDLYCNVSSYKDT